MIVSFACSSSPQPIGGVVALYEFANALSRRGHEVHIVHGQFFGLRIDHLDELSWFPFEPAIEHHIATGDEQRFPRADVIFGTGAPTDAGRPVHLVQGSDMLFPWLEEEAFAAPGLKICIASWLVTAGERFGVPRERFRVVHMGIDHQAFRVTVPLAARPPRVAVLHHDHPAKGWAVARAALEAARARVPDLTAAVFGTTVPAEPLPEWMTVFRDPGREVLVDEVYNRSRVFLQASDREGFGFTAVEAMACGCALVTTDNGGSDDYARPGETALLAPPRDVALLTEHLVRLLEDDPERQRLAAAGQRYVQRFDWDLAGEVMEIELERYLAPRPAVPER